MGVEVEVIKPGDGGISPCSSVYQSCVGSLFIFFFQELQGEAKLWWYTTPVGLSMSEYL